MNGRLIRENYMALTEPKLKRLSVFKFKWGKNVILKLKQYYHEHHLAHFKVGYLKISRKHFKYKMSAIDVQHVLYICNITKSFSIGV